MKIATLMGYWIHVLPVIRMWIHYITCTISGYNLQTLVSYHTLVTPRPGTVKCLPI